MIKLKKRNQTPPGGWKYKDDSGFWIEGRNIDTLISNIILHRNRNGSSKSVDPVEVEQEVLHQLCSILDGTWCKSDVEFATYEDKTSFFKLDKITSVAKAALEIAKGAELVDADELARRQDICRKCFLNKPPRGCACAVVYKTINASIPENRRDENLQMCGACGCMINAKIQLPMSAVNAANEGTNNKYPPHCWQLDKAEKPAVKKEKEVKEEAPVEKVVKKTVAKKKAPVKKKAVKKKVAKKKAK